MSILASLRRVQNQLASDNTVVLLVCIFIAAVFWIFSALSNRHSDQLMMNVEYVNKPEDKVVVNELPKEMTLNVSGQGWDLLGHQLRLRKQTLTIDVARFGVDGDFFPNTNLDYFENQLPSSFDVEQVEPKRLIFEFDVKGTKRVPVKLNARISLDPLFGLADTINVSPDSVTVSGPRSLVERFNFVPTDTITIANINENIVRNVPLQEPPVKTIRYSRETVKLRIEVEPFTEKKVEVPIRIINEPEKPVVLVTNTTVVSFRLPLHILETTSEQELAELFEVVADFSAVEEGETKVKLKLITTPSFSKEASISPKQVDFLYKK